MPDSIAPGQIVILNGAPRSGKSSIVAVIQDSFDGPWMNLGVDVFARGVTPKRFQPGIGLRPGPGPELGGDAPELEPFVPTFYAAMYESIAAHSRLGLSVVPTWATTAESTLGYWPTARAGSTDSPCSSSACAARSTRS